MSKSGCLLRIHHECGNGNSAQVFHAPQDLSELTTTSRTEWQKGIMPPLIGRMADSNYISGRLGTWETLRRPANYRVIDIPAAKETTADVFRKRWWGLLFWHPLLCRNVEYDSARLACHLGKDPKHPTVIRLSSGIWENLIQRRTISPSDSGT